MLKLKGLLAAVAFAVIATGCAKKEEATTEAAAAAETAPAEAAAPAADAAAAAPAADAAAPAPAVADEDASQSGGDKVSPEK